MSITIDCPEIEGMYHPKPCKTCGGSHKIQVYTEAEHFQEMLKFKLTYQDDYVLKVGTVNPSQILGKVYSEADHKAEVQKATANEREACDEIVINDIHKYFKDDRDTEISLILKSKANAIRARNQ